MYEKAKRLRTKCGTCGKRIDDYASNRKKQKNGKFYCSPRCRWTGTASAISLAHGGDGIPNHGDKRKSDAKWYRRVAVDQRKKVRAYYQKNRDKILERLRLRTRATKEEVVAAYGGKCMCCG